MLSIGFSYKVVSYNVCRMKLEIILIFVTLWLRTETYDVRCPDPSEWNHRATVNCSADKHYICLYNDLDDFYSESCDVKSYLSRKGRRRVKSPAINEVNCNYNKYQPLWFTTSGNSDCVLDKSFCNEEGQVTANNGSTSTDRACRCDYTKGYIYVTTPGDVCSCVPSIEDCACYMQNCPIGQKLTADYRCINTDQFAVQRCTEIGESADIGTEKSAPLTYVDNISETRTYAGNAAGGILILILIYIVLLMMLFINIRPYVIKTRVEYSDDLIVDKCESTFTYTVIAGGDLTINWKVKSKFTVKSIICQKDGEEIHSTKDRYTVKVKVSDTSTAISVTINKLESEDGGLYTCFVTDAVNLTSNCVDCCLNIMPCKQGIMRLRKYMQNVTMFRWNVMNAVKISVCNLPPTDKEYICIKGYSVNLEIKSEQNIKSVQWYQRTTKNLLIPLTKTSNKYHGGTGSNSSLVIMSAGMEDAGRYICLVNGTNPQIFGMKLKVILQEKLYEDIVHHREDLFFTKISAVDIAYKCLHDHGMVYITGREGTGKSTLCLELASFCDANDILTINVDINSINSIEIYEFNALYIIDDIQINAQNREHLKKIFSLNTTQSVKSWIAISCRTSEWLYLQNALKEIEKFKEDCLIQLDNCFTEEDKRKFLEAYFRANNIIETTHADSNFYQEEILLDDTIQVKLDREAVKKIIQTEPYYGFPLTTVLFCQDRKRLYMGEKYFTEPPMSLLNEIKEIYRIGKIEQKEEQMNEYCVLVLIATCKDSMCTLAHTKQFWEIKKNIFSIELKSDDNMDSLCEISDAANRMVGRFLQYFDKTYTFKHPFVVKAVMLSSDYCVGSFLIQSGSFKVIKEYVRSDKYEPRRDEVIHKLASDKTYTALCERLIDELRDSIKSHLEREEIYTYIYNEYIKLRDGQFLNVLVNQIESVCYNDLHQNLNISSNTTQARDDIQTQHQPRTITKYISAWHIIILLDKLTAFRKDQWIYCNQTLPDVIVICGLLGACKHKYLSNVAQKDILSLLLTMLKSKIDMQLSAESLSGILDEKGNTFFHYLTMYSEAEACFILETESRLLFGNYHCKSNTAGFTPLEMAAFMGKRKWLQLFLSNKTKRLLQFAKDGYEYYYGNKELSTKFYLDDHFENDVITSAEFGQKEDYEATFSYLRNLENN